MKIKLLTYNSHYIFFYNYSLLQMVNLGPGTDIRAMFINVPFPLEFRVYLFNVTNPMEIQNGAKPIVEEVGPFCYE